MGTMTEGVRAFVASQCAAQETAHAPQAFRLQHVIAVRCEPRKGADCMIVAEDSIRAVAASFDCAGAGETNANAKNSKGTKRAMTCIPLR